MSIIIFLPNYIGDVLMSTPALRFIKRRLPDERIYAVTSKQGAEVLSRNPAVSEIIERPASPSVPERFNLMKRINSIKPGTAILLRTTLFNAFLAMVSGAKARTGVDTEMAGIFLNRTIPKDARRNAREEYLMIAKLGVDEKARGGCCPSSEESAEESLRPEIFLSAEDEAFADSLLKKHSIGSDDRVVIINPGTTRPAKQWAPGRYAEIINALTGKNYYVLITGAETDRQLVRGIVGACSGGTSRVIRLAGETSIKQAAALLKRASFFISPDTAILHLGQAVGTKGIALFGSTDPGKYGPFDKKNIRIIYKKLDCSPCYKKFCPKAAGAAAALTHGAIFDKGLCEWTYEVAPCMDGITAEDVLKKIETFVAG
ncbi:MAG: glycosyltransferase family 9 protein [Elusimicrobiota bacterium]